MPVRLVSRRHLHEGWLRVDLATFRKPDGEEFTREVECHGDAVAVLPYDVERRMVVLVRLMRAAVLIAGAEGDLVEVPAGMTEGEEAEAAVRREAVEETGLQLRELEHVARAWSSPGVTTERIDLYLARYTPADRVGIGGGIEGENEDISVLEVPCTQAWADMQSGAISDLKTLALLMALKGRRPELFATS